MAKSIIFLDFDNTINNKSSTFIPKRMEAINKLCHVTGSKIVVSSTWAYYMNRQAIGLLLLSHGIRLDFFDDCFSTDNDEDWNTPKSRTAKILKWVEEEKVGPWIAVDDYNLDIPEQHYVKATASKGFDYNEALKKLMTQRSVADR